MSVSAGPAAGPTGSTGPTESTSLPKATLGFIAPVGLAIAFPLAVVAFAFT